MAWLVMVLLLIYLQTNLRCFVVLRFYHFCNFSNVFPIGPAGMSFRNIHMQLIQFAPNFQQFQEFLPNSPWAKWQEWWYFRDSRQHAQLTAGSPLHSTQFQLSFDRVPPRFVLLLAATICRPNSAHLVYLWQGRQGVAGSQNLPPNWEYPCPSWCGPCWGSQVGPAGIPAADPRPASATPRSISTRKA